MTDTQIFEPDGRAIPFVDEGDGPVKLVLIQERDVAADVLGVVAHYLAEEAGFHVLRIGHRADVKGDDPSLEDRVEDALAVIDHVGLGDTWIGGHGFGGTVARAFAVAHADRVNGLALLGVEENDASSAMADPATAAPDLLAAVALALLEDLGRPTARVAVLPVADLCQAGQWEMPTPPIVSAP